MPEIKQNDAGEYCLEGYGDADACYPTEDEAKAAVEALAAETVEEALVVEPDAPTEDMPAESEPEAEGETPSDTAIVDVPSGIRKLVLNIGGMVEKALGRKNADEGTGMKVVGNSWVIVWSNNFKDRDGEIFTAKAIDDYIARVDLGVVPLPELWVWHTPGTRIGQAQWVDRHGHFVLAGGEFDDTADGRSAKAYYSKHAHEKGISHGFKYPVEHFDGKHYENFNTFEFTPLPLGAEANLYTSFEGVKEAKMHEKKKAELIAVFGEKRAEEILANLDARGKALEELNVEFKDFVQPNGADSADTKAVDAAEKKLHDLIPELAEGSAEAVTAAMEAVKVAKASSATSTAAEAKVKALAGEIDKLRAEMRLRPRAASQSPETVLSDANATERGKQIIQTTEAQRKEVDKFWGTEVINNP